MPSRDSIGGPANCEPPFVTALVRRGAEVISATYVYGDKSVPTQLLARVWRVLKNAFLFRHLLRKHRPDVMHLNTAFDLKTILRDSVTLLLSGRTSTKIFLKLHGSMADEFIGSAWYVRMLIAFIHRRTDGFGCLSTEEMDSFGRLGFHPSKLYLVSNAVDLKGMYKRPPLNTAADVFQIVFVSRFIRAKGLLETITACNLLRERGLKFRLICIGDGEVSQEAKDMVGRLGLGRIVTFTGYIEEDRVNEYLVTSDLLVFPTSHPEGFPMVLFKAMAAGLPIVTTKIRAAADRLSDPENCLFCTSEPESVASRIQALAQDAQLRAEMSAHNVEKAKRYDPSVVAAEYTAIYQRLIKGTN